MQAAYPMSEYQRQALLQRQAQIQAMQAQQMAQMQAQMQAQAQAQAQQMAQAAAASSRRSTPSFWPTEQPVFEVPGAELDKVDMYPQHKPIQRPNLRDPRRAPSIQTDMWEMNRDTRPVAENPAPVPDNDVWGDKAAELIREEHLARKNRIGRTQGQGNHERPVEPIMTDDGGRTPDQDQVLYPVYNRYMDKVVLPAQKTKHHVLSDNYMLRGADPVLSGLMMDPNEVLQHTSKEAIYHDDNNINQLTNYFRNGQAAAIEDKTTQQGMRGAKASKVQVPVIEPLSIVGTILQRCGIYEPQVRKDIHVHTRKNAKKVLQNPRTRGTNTAAYNEKNAAGLRAVPPQLLMTPNKKQEQLELMVMHPTMTRNAEHLPESRPSIMEFLTKTLNQGDNVNNEPNIYQSVPQGATESRPSIMSVQEKKYKSDESSRVHNEPNVYQSVPQGTTESRPSIVSVQEKKYKSDESSRVHNEPNVYQSVPQGTTESRPSIVSVQQKKYKSDESSRVHNQPNVYQSVPHGSTVARPVTTGENTKPMNVGPMLMSHAAGTDAPAMAGRNMTESITNDSKKNGGVMIMASGAERDAAPASRAKLSDTMYMGGTKRREVEERGLMNEANGSVGHAAAPHNGSTIILQTRKQNAHLENQRQAREGSSAMIQPMHVSDTLITLRDRNQVENPVRQQVGGFDVNSRVGRAMTEREQIQTSTVPSATDSAILQRWGNLTNHVPARDLTEAAAPTMRGFSESTNTRRAFKDDGM